MNRNELCHNLRQEYNPQRGYGVQKIDHPEYRNIWFVIPPPTPKDYRPKGNDKKRLITALTKANQTLNKLKLFELSEDIDRTISYLFVRREALISSRMEGTWSTIDEVLSPLSLGLSTQPKSNNEAIRGYAAALEKHLSAAAKLKSRFFTDKIIVSLHQMVVSKDPLFQGTPGQIRGPGTLRSVVQIGGLGRKEQSIYNPTPPTHVARCLREFIEWLRDDLLVEMGDAGMGMLLPVRMALGHVHFESIHPFSDGNGRVGRILWPLQMIISNYMPLYLSGYVEAQKDEYYRALEIAQKKLNYLPFIEFICDAFDKCYIESERTRDALLALPSSWHLRAKFRENSTGLSILSLLVKQPIVTISEISTQLGVSYQAASTAVSKLTQAQILRERTGNKKHRIFAAEEVIAVLARTFGDDPENAIEYARQLMRS